MEQIFVYLLPKPPPVSEIAKEFEAQKEEISFRMYDNLSKRLQQLGLIDSD